MTDAKEAVEQASIAERLRAEEKRYQKIFDLVCLYRDRNQGGAFSDINQIKHALSGRDPVLEEAAAHIADLEARAERAEKENAELRAADRDHMSAKHELDALPDPEPKKSWLREQVDAAKRGSANWPEGVRKNAPAAPAPALPETPPDGLVKIKPLRWRKPTDHPQDMEDAAQVADGIGGRYSVTEDGLLWWAHDEFTFEQFRSIDEAKAAAEADWQKRVRARIDAATGGGHG